MRIIVKIKDFVANVIGTASYCGCIERSITVLKMLEAKNIIFKIKEHGVFDNIHEAEFKVFSQFGDDGIIQYLINNIPMSRKMFIEFGVENYTESNTRLLLMNDNWKGLVIDGNKPNIEYIKNDEIYWKHDLIAVSHFITKDNINKIISENGFNGEIGILSIDIDGNDYFIWESINSVKPDIVIIEYNSVFGKRSAVTIPYDPGFYRTKAHYSNLYWGCSLKALCLLAEKKGYVFIGSNSNGNNAYFILKDKIGFLKPCTLEKGYIESKFRESRNLKGELSFISGDRRIDIIKEMPIFDLEKCSILKIKDLFL